MKIETFSHYQNILLNIEDLPINSLIDSETNYYIAGGYALALIFAPRKDDLLIKEDYYDDIDIYFEKEEDLQTSIEKIKKYKQANIIEETENWFVFSLKSNNHNYYFQFMKKLFTKSPAFFYAYDILNCCVAFSAKTNEFYYKNKAIEATVAQVLDMNKEPNIVWDEDQAVQFPYRLNKFLARYKMKLSNNLHSTLMYSLIQDKNKKTTKDHEFRISWSTDEIEKVPKDFNIWALYRYAFGTNPKHIKYLSKFFKEELQ